VVAREDEEECDPKASCAGGEADGITDKVDERVKVEVDAELRAMPARFNVRTGCAQTGPCGTAVCDSVLESGLIFEVGLFGVDVEADAEACEEEAMVGPEGPQGSGNGGSILTPGDTNRLGWFSFLLNSDLFLDCCPNEEVFWRVPLSPRR
jgi:hypothetical protein